MSDPDPDVPAREVRELGARLGAAATPSRTVVRLTQAGRMRQDARSGWMRYRAQQTILVGACGFDWRAQTGPAGLVRVQDALIDRVGRLRVTALGLIPIARAGGAPQVTRGELMRYFAELAWAPDAILQNPQLRWRIEAPDRLVVSAGAGETSASVTLNLDGDRRIASTYASDRPRAVGRRFVPTPWRGRFFDYRLHLGVWIPFRGEVAWVIDGDDVVCWEGSILAWGAS